jgi:glycosyltransferase involved in cell wall biosynthesis
VGSNINISKFLVEEMGLRADKVCTIIDGMHMGFFDGSGEDNLKAKLGIAPERPIVLYTGALLSSKGSDNYFEAIPHVLKERPDAFFLVVGYPVEDSQALAQRLGVSEHCHVRGQGGLLQAAGLFKNRRCGRGSQARCGRRSQRQDNQLYGRRPAGGLL